MKWANNEVLVPNNEVLVPNNEVLHGPQHCLPTSVFDRYAPLLA